MKKFSNPKIWLVTELFYPEEDATAYIFTKIANYLTKEFDVGVICGPSFYNGPHKERPDGIFLHPNITVYRKNIINLDKNNFFKRTIRFLLLSFQLSFTLIKKLSKGDTVLIATNPAPLIIFIGLLKHFKTFKFHILVHDVFPENTIAAGLFKNKTNVIYKLLKLVFDMGYRQADHIIVLGKDMKELIGSKTHNRKKISIIPNWADVQKIKPISRSDTLIQKLGLTDKIVLQYAGNIGRVQGLKEVIDAVHLSQNTNLHLLIFGSGAYASKLVQYVKKENIQNVSFHGNYSRKEQLQILNTCDIAIVSLSKGMYGLGVPSKTYNILAAGKPILFLGEPCSEIYDLVINEEVGWSIDISAKKELIDFFTNLKLADIDVLNALGVNARKLAEEKYPESKILNEFLKSIKSIS